MKTNKNKEHREELTSMERGRWRGEEKRLGELGMGLR